VKRLHVHVAVENVEQSVQFYSALFASRPAVLKADYAKWMLDDPRVNFAISARGRAPGVDHLGIQVENSTELDEVAERLKSAQRPIFEEGSTTCCYAKSEKAWVLDPSGVSWETFLTVGESTTYGEDAPAADSGQNACCTPDLTTLGTPVSTGG
jgi:hypothetical protein